MDSSAPAAEAVAAHARELATLRALLEQASSEVVGMHMGTFGRRPKGSALSYSARDRFLQLLQENPLPADTGVVVDTRGEDWVRIWLPSVGWDVPLRMRPETVRRSQDPLLEEDLFGPVLGHPVLFWKWSNGEMTSFSLVRVESMQRWGIECLMIEEAPVGAGVLPLVSGHQWARNDEDSLDDVVAPRAAEEPVSEQELEDQGDEELSDERGDAAPGDET